VLKGVTGIETVVNENKGYVYSLYMGKTSEGV
jgi:hypothetical protein